MTKFKLNWINGTSEIVQGETIDAAFKNAGYGAGAINALSSYEEVKTFFIIVRHACRTAQAHDQEMCIEVATIDAHGTVTPHPAFNSAEEANAYIQTLDESHCLVPLEMILSS